MQYSYWGKICINLDIPGTSFTKFEIFYPKFHFHLVVDENISLVTNVTNPMAIQCGRDTKMNQISMLHVE